MAKWKSNWEKEGLNIKLSQSKDKCKNKCCDYVYRSEIPKKFDNKL